MALMHRPPSTCKSLRRGFLLAALICLPPAPGLRAELNPDQATRWLIYGNQLYKQGQLQDAEQAYRKATEFDPSNADGWQGLGNVLQDEHKAKEAKKAYARAKRHAEPGAGDSSSQTGQNAEGQDAGNTGPSRFALGVGYPDIRARVALFGGLDLESKNAFAQGMQGYSGRLIWNYADWGPLKFTVGGEGGIVELGGVDSLNGSGPFGDGFLGLEYPIGRFRLSVDVDEAYISATDLGHTYATTYVVYNTALYLYLF
jgi:tetratricopeptide (TPR) repeat protein